MFKKLFMKVQAYMALHAKINEAEALFKKDGQRRFVVPFYTGELEVLTKDEALALKRTGQLARDLTAKLLFNACYYYTSTAEAHAAIKCGMPKREQKRRIASFYKWFDRHHSKDCI